MNHLEGHALTARLTDGIGFPYLLLLVSGGHTQLVAVRGVGDYVRLGTTIDDAIGEAFDKVAKLLGLPYPGGPQVENARRRAATPSASPCRGRCSGRAEPNFSLSGLKTALRLEAEKHRAADRTPTSPISAPASRPPSSTWWSTAPASALRAFRGRGRAIRRRSSSPAASPRTRPCAAPSSASPARPGCASSRRRAALCGDNGAMIAWAGLERLRLGLVDDMTVPARARWPLDAARDEAGAKA